MAPGMHSLAALGLALRATVFAAPHDHNTTPIDTAINPAVDNLWEHGHGVPDMALPPMGIRSDGHALNVDRSYTSGLVVTATKNPARDSIPSLSPDWVDITESTPDTPAAIDIDHLLGTDRLSIRAFDGVVYLPFSAEIPGNTLQRRGHAVEDTLTEELQGYPMGYMVINIDIGSSQHRHLLVDTTVSKLFLKKVPNSSTALNYSKLIAGVKHDGYRDTAIIDDHSISDVSFGNSTAGYQDILVPVDGILGLAPDSDQQWSILSELVAKGRIESRLFSISGNPPRHHASLSSNLEIGHLIFGRVDVKKFDGHLHTFPLKDAELTGKYKISSRVSVGALEGNATSLGRYNFILDTASPRSRLHRDILKQWQAHSPVWTDVTQQQPLGEKKDACVIQVDCDSVEKAPSLLIHLQGEDAVEIPFRDFVESKSDRDTNECFFISKMSSLCGNLNATETADGILGSEFFRRSYTVFDQDRQVVLVANRKSCCYGSEIVSLSSDKTAQRTLRGKCSERPHEKKSAGTGRFRTSLATFVLLGVCAWLAL